MRTLTQQRIGNPIAQAQRDAAAIQAWLNDRLGVEANVRPAIVFTNPQAEVKINGDPTIPILRADKRKPSLKAYVKERTAVGPDSQTVEIDALNEALGL